jgi:hypothetical protein
MASFFGLPFAGLADPGLADPGLADPGLLCIPPELDVPPPGLDIAPELGMAAGVPGPGPFWFTTPASLAP